MLIHWQNVWLQWRKRMNKIKIGTRDSILALCQTNFVKDYLEKKEGITVELLPMKTTGDRILNKALDQIGGKGLFMKELDIALLEGRTDLSVHSLKDVTMDLPDELPLLGVSRREDPRDVLVLPEGVRELDYNKPVGCSSKRRILQFQKIYKDVECKSVRGNIQTRLSKLDSGEYSGLLLAAAGLKRLGLEKRIFRYFEPHEMVPAAGQGSIAVQGRKDFKIELLSGYFDKENWYRATAERAFVRRLDGGCSSPIAAYASVQGTELTLTGLYYTLDMGSNYLVKSMKGNCSDANQLGILLAENFLRERYGS